jgi:hypothetical protein
MNTPTFPLVVESPTLLTTVTPLALPTLDSSSYKTPTISPLDIWLTQDAFATPIRTPVTPVWASSPEYVSDDGQKIVFYQDDRHETVYAANADGSNKQLIIKSEALPLLGQGEVKALTFVPKTHIVLFNTYLCNQEKHLYDASDCTVGIYSADTDTGEIDQLLAGLSGNTMHDRNFEVSPDGRYISVANSGHIDIYDLWFSGSDDVHLAYQNAIMYSLTQPDEYLPGQYWLPDSSGLIAVVATNGSNDPGTPPSSFAVFRYEVSGTAIKIPLDNKYITRYTYSMHNYWSISPDRNWIFFAGEDKGDGKDEVLYYIGDLTSGHTQVYEPEIWDMYFFEWSPDSKHFAFTKSIGFIGSVDGSFVPVGGEFIEWIDASHYYYHAMEGWGPQRTQTYIGTLPTENAP